MAGKYSTIHYHSYLELDKIIGAQNLRSVEVGKPAHEEMLFIITHQAYELWFKQIIHELKSVLQMFADDKVDERNIGTAVGRLQRIEEILDLLVNQIRIMETMTPLDFLDFRAYLFPASGFQSFQFRMIESLLGLPEDTRMTYNNHHYAKYFPEDQKEILDGIYKEGTLFEAIEDWLERTPFIKYRNFDFLKEYDKAVRHMIEKEQAAIEASDYLSDEEKVMRKKMMGDTNTYFQAVLDKKAHAKLIESGALRLSYDATVAALFIKLYKEQPILHLPFMLLTNLVDIDQKLTTWRQRHAQMVMRMLGKKVGTGGSSGHEYLSKTAEQHHIFTDFHNISTLMIPRSSLPPLPADLLSELGFYYTHNKNNQLWE